MLDVIPEDGNNCQTKNTVQILNASLPICYQSSLQLTELLLSLKIVVINLAVQLNFLKGTSWASPSGLIVQWSWVRSENLHL